MDKRAWIHEGRGTAYQHGTGWAIKPAIPSRYYLLTFHGATVATALTMGALARYARDRDQGMAQGATRFAVIDGDSVLLRHCGKRISFTKAQAEFVASVRNGTAIPVC